MLKNLARFFVVVLILLLSVEVAYAAVGKSFGGKMSNIMTVSQKAGPGFTCNSIGKIISVKKKHSGVAVDFFLNITTKLVTRFEPRVNQSILGLYDTEKKIISCEDKDGKKKEFDVYNIKYGGTSRI